MIIFTGSPRVKGNCDTAATLFQQGLGEQGVAASVHAVHEGRYRPCIACGFCARHPGRCALDTEGDDTASLLQRLQSAPALTIIVPVFFYGPPAQCKGVIDRAQKLWWPVSDTPASAVPAVVSPASTSSGGGKKRPAYIISVAGRTEGARLFEANLLIARCFARALGFTPLPESDLLSSLLLRGLDGPCDLAQHSCMSEQVRAYGRAVGATFRQ